MEKVKIRISDTSHTRITALSNNYSVHLGQKIEIFQTHRYQNLRVVSKELETHHPFEMPDGFTVKNIRIIKKNEHIIAVKI
jgi:hypothetical protein